ncbi:spore germination protein [Tumebacillus flagellatus]|uniref:Spore gernimation protein GerA n=1 Tax=Tumebacillus flagellatus TaxID=1157490 RepID=A0A074LII6_9BACL|nr:spore germination protein [Tumebacillus flagellatus]KEO82021.1 spore gernimation protein GerA [Tumebacillus flagellatus]
MSILQKASRWFTVDDSVLDEDFSLVPDDMQDGGEEQGPDHRRKSQREERPTQKQKPEEKPSKREEPQSREQREHRDEPKPAASKPSPSPRKRHHRVKPKKIGARQEPEAREEPEADTAEDTADRLPEKNAPAAELPLKIRRPQKKSRSHQPKIMGKELQPDPRTENLDFKPTYPEFVSPVLEENRRTVEDVFQIPLNADFIIRDFTISTVPPVQAFAVFMEGLSDKTIINNHILEPLMLLAEVPHEPPALSRADLLRKTLIPGNQLTEETKWKAVKNTILTGTTAVFVDGMKEVLLVETKGFEHRSVGDTKTETVVRGPHDAFTEHFRTNTGLVRARLRTEKLITEITQVGELAPTDVAIMYVDGICNPKLVREVRRRIQDVKVDFLQDSGILEQMIEDGPPGYVPRMLATERPDRVAQSLSEGYVAVFVGQSSQVLVLPTMLWTLLHTAEDAYIRYPFGTFLRLIRFAAFLIAMLLPALYIAVTNYHPEMIPTDLMLTIASSREKVPFPVVVEVLLMEIAIELIREAGIRIPNVIGPTIGIVGALILGQAAVQAGIVSPLLVIVVSVTALAAFTMPNYNLSFAVRTLRFLMMAMAAVWGFYGITLGVMVLLTHWTTLKSFGVPMMTHVAPYKQSSEDVILRGPVFRQEVRPGALYPGLMKRQLRFLRKWDPRTHDSREAEERIDEENRRIDTEGINQSGRRGGKKT